VTQGLRKVESSTLQERGELNVEAKWSEEGKRTASFQK
jgi:hypothetical protein